MTPQETRILDHNLAQHLIAKGYTDQDARKLIAERRKLNDQIFDGCAAFVVDDESEQQKRLNEINQIVFSALH